MQQPTLLRHSDIEAYRTWRRRRVGPAYFRGYPTWMWQTALKRRASTSR
jgi:hypothetical protein